jgi:hypothetical protein
LTSRTYSARLRFASPALSMRVRGMIDRPRWRMRSRKKWLPDDSATHRWNSKSASAASPPPVAERPDRLEQRLHARELLAAAALGGERGRLGLEADAKLEQRQHLGERRRIDALGPGTRPSRTWRVRANVPMPRCGRDHAARAQAGDRLAHDRAAHAEFGDELALAGSFAPAAIAPGRDARAKLRDHLLGQARRFERAEVATGYAVLTRRIQPRCYTACTTSYKWSALFSVPKLQLPPFERLLLTGASAVSARSSDPRFADLCTTLRISDLHAPADPLASEEAVACDVGDRAR